jgi:shikimate kinase
MEAALSIFLVGMMGAGKSTVGVRLARRLGRPFIDLDRELERRLGVDIPTVFDLEGEAGFRQRETGLLEELSGQQGLVLATGGGVVIAPVNRALLRQRGLVIYLRPTVAELWQRLRRDRHRPLLKSEDPRERIRQLAEDREPLYREVADQIVHSGRQPAEHIVDEIVEWLDGPEARERARCKVSLSI